MRRLKGKERVATGLSGQTHHFLRIGTSDAIKASLICRMVYSPV
jgi:hypothetical protein